MNIHTRTVEEQPTVEQFKDAMRVLRQWVAHSDLDLISSPDADILARFVPTKYPQMSAEYPDGFVADETYRATMPDLQDGPSKLSKGDHHPLQHLGISNFRERIRN